jgi:hypothetical protein
MATKKLVLEELDVTSFVTEPTLMSSIGGGYCCTGCVSGCGINPTASGCQSGGSDGGYCPMEPIYVY